MTAAELLHAAETILAASDRKAAVRTALKQAGVTNAQSRNRGADVVWQAGDNLTAAELASILAHELLVAAEMETMRKR